MKLVKCGKIAIASLCILSMAAGAAMPALAVSPAGQSSLTQLEECNAADEQVAAIRAAAEKVKVSFDEVDRIWDFNSPFQEKAGKKAVCNTSPWMFIIDRESDVYFNIDFTYFGSQPMDLDTVVIRAGDTKYSFECDPDYTDSAYIKDTKSYMATSSFDLDDEMVGWLRDMLAQEKVIVRFADGGKTFDYTWTAEDRQAVTDMINLYDLLKAATPEVRAQALNR